MNLAPLPSAGEGDSPQASGVRALEDMAAPSPFRRFAAPSLSRNGRGAKEIE
jgi:hypothetical protein